MQFDGGLAAAEFRPGENTQTEVDRRRIEGVDGLLEADTERFVEVQLAGAADQPMGEVAKDSPVVNAVGIGQGAACNAAAEAGVVKFGSEGAESGFDVAEALAVGELGEGEREEMIAAGEFAESAVTAVASDAGVEFVARQVVQKLAEDGRSNRHGRASCDGR